jgi:DinB superfamily
MTTVIANDLEQARRYFAQTKSRIAATARGLSPAQLRFKPSPDRWSILEILEHMATVHQVVLRRVLEQLPQAPGPEPGRDSQLLDALVVKKIPDRSIKAKAPEFIQPTGEVAPEDSLARIFADYERMIEILEATPGLREHILESPPLRVVTQGAHTTLDGYQWVLTAAAHDERHVRQIEELKTDPGYPVQQKSEAVAN